jgi:hypothetical protein
MYLREIGWDGVDLIDMAQDRDQFRALVNMELNLRPYNWRFRKKGSAPLVSINYDLGYYLLCESLVRLSIVGSKPSFIPRLSTKYIKCQTCTTAHDTVTCFTWGFWTVMSSMLQAVSRVWHIRREDAKCHCQFATSVRCNNSRTAEQNFAKFFF